MFERLRRFFSKSTSLDDARELFATEAAEIIGALPQITKVERVPDDFALLLRAQNGHEHRVFLTNAYAEARDMSPADRKRHILHMFGAIGHEIEQSWESARSMLVPVLRSATFGFEIAAKAPEAAFVRRPFLPFLDRVVAVDQPTAMHYVGVQQLDTWKLTEAEVFAAADARIHLLADPAIEKYDAPHGPAWIVATRDSYEACRLLVPGWLASFRGRVEGEPVAIVPQRSMLLVSGDARPEQIEWLLDKAEGEFNESNRRLSPAPYSANAAGQVVPYVPGPDHPLAQKVRIAHEKLALYEYGAQKEALEAAHEADGTDVFVASYQVFQAPDGRIRSMAVWTKTVDTYLPRAESVMLVELGDGEGAAPKHTVQVPFEAVEARLTPVPGLHPVRYQTGEFPDEAELQALAAAYGG